MPSSAENNYGSEPDFLFIIPMAGTWKVRSCGRTLVYTHRARLELEFPFYLRDARPVSGSYFLLGAHLLRSAAALWVDSASSRWLRLTATLISFTVQTTILLVAFGIWLSAVGFTLYCTTAVMDILSKLLR